jgi:hypothetical protein
MTATPPYSGENTSEIGTFPIRKPIRLSQIQGGIVKATNNNDNPPIYVAHRPIERGLLIGEKHYSTFFTIKIVLFRCGTHPKSTYLYFPIPSDPVP